MAMLVHTPNNRCKPVCKHPGKSRASAWTINCCWFESLPLLVTSSLTRLITPNFTREQPQVGPIQAKKGSLIPRHTEKQPISQQSQVCRA